MNKIELASMNKVELVSMNKVELASMNKVNEGPTLETLDFTIRFGSTPAFSYFDLYLYSAYATHYVC